MFALLIKLFFAHFLGDFLLQPSAWVQERSEKKIFSRYLYWHIAVHALLLLIVLQADVQYWVAVLCILFSHFFIDLAKSYLDSKVNTILLFFLDQMAHLVVIGLVTYFYFPFSIEMKWLLQPQLLLLLTTLVVLTFVLAVVIRVLLSQWDVDENEDDSAKGVSRINAGKYIGIIERLLIFLFIIIDFWEGIGFLLAAKSIFRIGNLTQNKDKNLTEYILVGTLLSFGFAIGISLLYKYLLAFV